VLGDDAADGVVQGRPVTDVGSHPLADRVTGRGRAAVQVDDVIPRDGETARGGKADS